MELKLQASPCCDNNMRYPICFVILLPRPQYLRLAHLCLIICYDQIALAGSITGSIKYQYELDIQFAYTNAVQLLRPHFDESHWCLTSWWINGKFDTTRNENSYFLRLYTHLNQYQIAREKVSLFLTAQRQIGLNLKQYLNRFKPSG